MLSSEMQPPVATTVVQVVTQIQTMTVAKVVTAMQTVVMTQTVAGVCAGATVSLRCRVILLK
jgi:hypothetical protein